MKQILTASKMEILSTKYFQIVITYKTTLWSFNHKYNQLKFKKKTVKNKPILWKLSQFVYNNQISKSLKSHLGSEKVSWKKKKSN